MITRYIPALLLALTPFWSFVSIAADDVQQVDPVVAIDGKLVQKRADIDAVNKEFEQELANFERLKNEGDTLERKDTDLQAKRDRSKSALGKQYSRLLDDPDTDLTSFQIEYQQAWAFVEKNQSLMQKNSQEIAESKMRLSQIKQKKARFTNEYENLKESRIEARVKRLAAELRESDVLETSYTTTCSTTMTLGECANQGKHMTKQKAVKTFKAQLLDSLTESNLAKQNLDGVQLNIDVQERQLIKSGFSSNNTYATQMQALVQAKPEATVACKLLNVEYRHCLNIKLIIEKNNSVKVALENFVRQFDYNLKWDTEDFISAYQVSYEANSPESILEQFVNDARGNGRKIKLTLYKNNILVIENEIK